MRWPLFTFPALSLVLSACGPPPPEAFDKLPVGAPTAAIDQRRAVAAQSMTQQVAPAPVVTVKSAELEATGQPVPLEVAAVRAMALSAPGQSDPVRVAGALMDLTGVRYDGHPFLVGEGMLGPVAHDPSEALKSMAAEVTPCEASGPVWQNGARYAVGLTCL